MSPLLLIAAGCLLALAALARGAVAGARAAASRDERVGWWLVAAATIGWVVSVVAVAVAAPHDDGVLHDLGAAGGVTGLLLLALATMRMDGGSTRLLRSSAFDAVGFVMALGYVGLTRIVLPGAEVARGSIDAGFADAAVLVDLGMLMVLVVLANSRDLPPRRTVSLLMLSLAAFAGSGFVEQVAELGAVAGLGGMLVALLVALVATRQAHQAAHDEPAFPAGERAAMSVLLVVAGPATILLLLLYEVAFEAANDATFGVAIASCFLAFGRLVSANRESRRAASGLELALAEQQRRAVTDALTGLYNRRHFEESLRIEGARAARHRRPLALLMVDLDHFKAINDTHGHAAGDSALRAAAATLRETVRDVDVLARYGGEEFAVLLPDTDGAGALVVAERCCAAVRAAVVDADDQELRLTASVGVACHPDDSASMTELVHMADQALYVAKRAGRDRVSAAGKVSPEGDTTGASSRAVVRAMTALADSVDEALDLDGASRIAEQVASTVALHAGLDEARVAACGLAARLATLERMARGGSAVSCSLLCALLDTVAGMPDVAAILSDVRARRLDAMDTRIVALANAWPSVARSAAVDADTMRDAPLLVARLAREMERLLAGSPEPRMSHAA